MDAGLLGEQVVALMGDHLLAGRSGDRESSGTAVERLHTLVTGRARATPEWSAALDRLASAPGEQAARAGAADAVAAMCAGDAAFDDAVGAALSEATHPAGGLHDDGARTGVSAAGSATTSGPGRRPSLRVAVGVSLAVVLLGAAGVVTYRIADTSSSGGSPSTGQAQEGRNHERGPAVTEPTSAPTSTSTPVPDPTATSTSTSTADPTVTSAPDPSPEPDPDGPRHKFEFRYAKQVPDGGGTVNADVHASVTIRHTGFEDQVDDCAITTPPGTRNAVFSLSTINLNPKSGDPALDASPHLDLTPIGGDRLYAVETTPEGNRRCGRKFPPADVPGDRPVVLKVPASIASIARHTVVVAGVPTTGGEIGFTVRLCHTDRADEQCESQRAVFKV